MLRCTDACRCAHSECQRFYENNDGLFVQQALILITHLTADRKIERRGREAVEPVKLEV